MKRYNICVIPEGSENAVTVNHEPMRKSQAYEAMEILRRSYQALGYSVVHLEYGRFAVANSSNWIVSVALEPIIIDKP